MAEKDSGDKKPEQKESAYRWCAVCGDKLDADHPGIHCKQSHHLCGDCSGNFKRSIFEAGPEAFPPKCGFCACEINLLSFERQLTGTDMEGERSMFLTYMLMHQLDGDVMSNCPWCPFFCTREVNELAEANFVYCQNPACYKVTCALCMKECVPCDDDEEEDEAVRLGMAEHFACAEKEATLGQVRNEMQQAIDDGIKPACPTCKHRGTKDDNCTHMTCEECQTVWCYVCGLDVNSVQCDKAAVGGLPEYRHNADWYENTSRCPMYLSDIHQVDERWPEDDDEAKAMLHQQLALHNMRRVYNRIGPAQYKALIAAYPTVGPASGFTEEQIREVDLSKPLFERAEPGEVEIE